MASTNKTQYFELSQYVSSDKPTYLVDYNGDMSKIDGGLHTATVNSSEALTHIGNLTDLTTITKTSLVSAVNEVEGEVTTNTTSISANTTAIGTIANLNTSDKSSLVSATNEVNTKIGNLSNLNTYSKANVVSAINEIEAKTSPAYYVAHPTTQQNLPTSWDSPLTIALSEPSVYTGNLTLSNNRIVIGSGINHVRVSANASFTEPTTNGYVILRVIKNTNTVVCDSVMSALASSSFFFFHCGIPATIVEVDQNDELRLEILSTCGGTTRADSTEIYLCVEKVD